MALLTTSLHDHAIRCGGRCRRGQACNLRYPDAAWAPILSASRSRPVTSLLAAPRNPSSAGSASPPPLRLQHHMPDLVRQVLLLAWSPMDVAPMGVGQRLEDAKAVEAWRGDP